MADRRQTYIYGNTAMQVEPLRRSPEPRYPDRERKEQQAPKVSKQVNRNRHRAEVMDLSYVLFLTAVAVVIVAAFVFYLQLQSTIATRSSNITSLQRQISDLSMENDAALGMIEDSVDLETVKVRANQLGMVYMNNSQVIEYSSPTAEYIKQYEDIPESGILAQSDVILE
ncbi:MAG: hypothetical protein R3Y58_10690 [Eubacteriales bacterium]